MNIFLRELIAYRKGILFWSLGMIALVGSGMAKYAGYQSTGQSINTILAQFPKSVQVIFGISGFDLTRASGFYGVLFLYIALMATIHAVLLGTDIISKEERDRTTEFLFVKPISRATILTSKLAGGFVNLVILNLATLFSSIYFVGIFNKSASVTPDILILISGLLILQLLFFMIGAAIAATSPKPKASSSTAASVLLLTFILSMFISINSKLDNLKYFTPFKYFDAHTLMEQGQLDPIYVLISIVVIVGLLFTAYRSYARRDLEV